MSPQGFDHLLSLVGSSIKKSDTNFRKAIPPAECVAITLRSLASGESQHSLSFLFRVGRSAISRIIIETLDAIYASLSDTYLTLPARPMTGLTSQKSSMIYGTFRSQ